MGALADWLFERLFTVKDDGGPRPLDPVKLIHVDDVRGAAAFARYQDVRAITHREYRQGRAAWEGARRTVRRLLDAQDRLAELDTDTVVQYGHDRLTVPRSVLRQPVTVPLPRPPRPGTWAVADDGTVVESVVVVPGGWRVGSTRVRYEGPSEVVHRDEIESLRAGLAAMTEHEAELVREVRSSRFGHPVLFVSHRWASTEHPDPDGDQLRGLQQLRECFLIYDYSSFPQEPLSTQERAELDLILAHMDELVRNVVVLSAPDYLQRGWCVYEYLVASLTNSTVCDEVRDAGFRELRDWSATRATVSPNPWRDSFESMQQNYINERLLESVNTVAPAFTGSLFTRESDRALVTSLLLGHLKAHLPPKKEHVMHVGEWTTVPWTDEELASSFTGRLPVPRTGTLASGAFHTDVPATLAEAVARRYEIRSPSWRDLVNPMAGIAGHVTALSEARRARRATADAQPDGPQEAP